MREYGCGILDDTFFTNLLSILQKSSLRLVMKPQKASETSEHIASSEKMINCLDIPNSILHTNKPKEFLTLQEVSNEIGCTRRFIEKRIDDGEIATFKPSKRMVRIERREVDRWIEFYTYKKSGVVS